MIDANNLPKYMNVVGYYALARDTGNIGGRDHRKNCPSVPYWLNSSQPHS